MSKLKAWHILVPTFLLVVAAPVTIGFTSVKKTQEEVTRIDSEIATAQDKASQLKIREAEMLEAQYQTASIAKELSQMKNAKLPIWSGNAWWRSLRQGMALTPGPASIRIGEQGAVVNLPDGMPAMFDMWFLLREDLGVMLRDFFDSTGVAVECPMNLPRQSLAPYTAQDLLMMIPLTGVQVRGPYEDVLRFFRRLGDAPLLITVEGPVTFRPEAGSSGAEVTATANLMVILFPNLSPDEMSNLQALIGSLGAGAAAAGAGGGGPMGMGGPPMMGGPMAGGPMMGAPGGGPSGGGSGGGPPMGAPAMGGPPSGGTGTAPPNAPR